MYPYTTEAPVDSATDSTKSLRKTAQTTWDKKKPSVKGSRLMVFIAGGVTYSEIRAMHELCHSMGRDIIIGSTHIITPRQFIYSLRHLAHGPARPPLPLIPPYKSVRPPASASGPMPPSQRPPPHSPSNPSSRPGQGPPPPRPTYPQGQPSSPHRPVTPNYPGAPSSGGMRTIQKDASGRFVAPSSPNPPRSPAHAPPQQYQQQQGGDQAPQKKKMFGFI